MRDPRLDLLVEPLTWSQLGIGRRFQPDILERCLHGFKNLSVIVRITDEGTEALVHDTHGSINEAETKSLSQWPAAYHRATPWDLASYRADRTPNFAV